MLAININNIEYIELLLNELSIFTPTKLITISLLDRCSLNSAQYNQIVFIDSSVKDYENLTNNFTQPTEFIILDSQQDGLAQITHHLSQYDSVDAIHIVSHGDAGQLLLGNTNLNKTINNLKTLYSKGFTELRNTKGRVFSLFNP